ncbi:MAG: ADOP family duplicated permease, partial [Bryobacteraceae bacterium]
VYVPLAMRNLFVPAAISSNGKEVAWLHIVGRIKPGAGAESSRLAFDATYQRVYEQQYGEAAPSHIAFASGAQGTGGLQREHGSTLVLLLVAAAVVLLTACANVANLLLSRAASRRKEFAVRLAVGASRGHLVRQLLSESLLLSFAGGLLGFLLSIWMHDGLSSLVLQGSNVAETFQSAANLKVFAFNVGISLIVGVLFGLAPAFATTKPDLAPALKGTSDDSRVRRFSLRNGLVVLQVALSMVLLVGAGLLARSLFNLRAADLGFARENLAIFSVNLADQGYKDASATAFLEELSRRLQGQPGVRAVSYANVSPLSGNLWMWSFGLPGKPYARENNQIAYTMFIGPGFFSTIGSAILQGREFTDRDREGSQRVAVVNDHMARQFWPGESPIGRRFTISKQEVEIVGVVRDSKYRSIKEKDHFTVYTPMLQEKPTEITFHIRAAGDVLPVIAAARQQARSLDAKMPLYAVRTMEAQIETGLTLERMLTTLSLFFGGLALLLAGIGLYGVISYAVTRRTREIGIRMALGAQQTTVLRNVLTECATLAGVGVLLGAPAAIAASRWVRSYLFGLSATDMPTYIGIGFGLLAIGILAGTIPARRATQVDPLVALRQD